MTLAEIQEQLRSVRANYNSRKAADISAELASLKKAAVAAGHEEEAKDLCCLEQTLSIQEAYLKAFAQMKAGHYYEGWCTLEVVENAITWLLPHYSPFFEQYDLKFIQSAVQRFQTLFPYKQFISPEFLIRSKKCSICGKEISIRKPCGHSVGEIYKGEICCHLVSDIEVIGTAIVTNPSQKYSVVFLSDPVTKEKKDQYNYAVIRYLASRLKEPFDGWSHIVTKRRHPHSRYAFVGRNEKCPCESGKKYKKCCLPTEGVLRPHIQFSFAKPPPSGMPELEYSV